MQFDHTTESIHPDITKILTIAGDGALELPVGGAQSRPGDADVGSIRFNTEQDVVEMRASTGWKPLTGLDTGSSTITVRTATSNTTVTASDCVILVNATTYAVVTLPPASSLPDVWFVVKRLGNGIVGIASTSLIDDADMVTITAKYSSVTVVSDGNQWWII